jgi:hypothetical protein
MHAASIFAGNENGCMSFRMPMPKEKTNPNFNLTDKWACI